MESAGALPAMMVSTPLFGGAAGVLYVMEMTPLELAVNATGVLVNTLVPTAAEPPPAACVIDRYTTAPGTPAWLLFNAVRVTTTLALPARDAVAAIGCGCRL